MSARRKTAFPLTDPRYILGEPCEFGHDGTRYARPPHGCVWCKQAKNRQRYALSPPEYPRFILTADWRVISLTCCEPDAKWISGW